MTTEKNTFLKMINEHERDSNISFEEETHTYTIKTKTNNKDTSFTSVTTWIHSLFPKFDADSIIEKMQKSKNWEQNKYYNMTADEIKALWKKNGQAASKAGTQLHNDIEAYYNQHEVDNSSVEFQYFLDFEKDRTKDPSNDTMIPYRTEWTIYDEELRLSGSVDMIYEYKDSGILTIYDWKRCKDIKKCNEWEQCLVEELSYIPNTNYWHYALQLNTYREILERNYNKNIQSLWLVCLHPDKPGYQKLSVPILKTEMNILFQKRIETIYLEEKKTDTCTSSIYKEDGI